VRTTTGTALVRVAATLWLVAGVAYLMAEALVARHLPGYSYSADYISDLGQPLHSPMAVWMNGAFIAQGMAFALAAALVVVAARAGPASAAFLGFAVMYGAGSAVVGLFPSGGSGNSARVLVGAGAWERGAIYAIIGWQLLAAVAALSIRRQAYSTDSGSDPTARP